MEVPNRARVAEVVTRRRFLRNTLAGARIAALCAAAAASAPALAHADFIGFDDLPNGTIVTNQFSGAALLRSVNIVTDAAPFTAHQVNLAAFSNVAQIVVRDVTDSAGLAYDDFSFDQVILLPEPGTFALLSAGLVAAGYLRRRR